MNGSLRFLPIDLERHAGVAIAFCKDAVDLSIAPGQFEREAGPDGALYLEKLRGRIAADPGSCVHLWEGDEIIGQIDMSRIATLPDMGYVNLFYLVPDRRGTGLGTELIRYAEDRFRKIGCTRARLSVSDTNLRARRFYEKHGWRDVGPRPDRASVRLMERILTE
jgi:GNAT superfamily N-acetyltransferase